VFYTPAQFEGLAEWKLSSGELLAFAMAVPVRDTNVDANVIDPRTGRGKADIGFVEEMALTTTRSPREPDAARLAEARDALRRAFYRFSQVEWLDFASAVERSRAQRKPLHLVILFGSMDDESC
jgi:hypothetical protein